jgi:serine phosphatase RsbU (regulator of sigma subunit)
MGVCDAIDKEVPLCGAMEADHSHGQRSRRSPAMTAARLPKVAGISPPHPSSAHTSAPSPLLGLRPVDRLAAVQDRLASWICDLTTLHELTEQLARTSTLDDSLSETLRAGASLVGASRGMIVLDPPGPRRPNDPGSPGRTVGLGLGHADLGAIETVPHAAAADRGQDEVIHADLRHGADVGRRHREVAGQLGLGASYSLRLVTHTADELGAAVWFYDEPAEPTARRRHLVGLYCRYAAEHTARLTELAQARTTVDTLRDGLLPARLPRVPGVRMAVRHRRGPRGGSDWYDALPLPEGMLGLAVGGVTGSGPEAVATMGRLRAALRAYAVMEAEDPVAVLSDLELLLRMTEPARSATALFCYVEPARRRLVMAGAGHCPPLLIGERRAVFVETSLSAPLGMLGCWEAPSVEVTPQAGETFLLYTDGLLHRTGESMDRAIARLQAAAVSASPAARDDPGELVDHVLRGVLPDGLADDPDSPEDVVLLAVRFD